MIKVALKPNEVKVLKQITDGRKFTNDVIVTDLNYLSEISGLSYVEVDNALRGLHHAHILDVWDKKENWCNILPTRYTFEVAHSLM